MKPIDYENGVGEFLRLIGDLESDIPLISTWFTNYFLVPSFERKMLEPNGLKWPALNDEMFSFDAYFKVAAEVFKYQNKSQSWKEIGA
jgi:hypothetical protein